MCYNYNGGDVMNINNIVEETINIIEKNLDNQDLNINYGIMEQILLIVMMLIIKV